MKNLFENMRASGVITSILSILYGIILIIWAEQVANTICYAIGAAVILVGIAFIIQYIRKDIKSSYYQKELVSGIVAIIAGILVIANVELIQSIVPVILGFIILFSGIVKLQNSFDLMRLGQKNWWTVLIFAGFNIVFALFLLIKPTWFNDLLFVLIGVGMVISGISDLIITFILSKNVKKYIKEDDIIE